MNAIVPVAGISRADVKNKISSVEDQINEKKQEISDLEAKGRN